MTLGIAILGTGSIVHRGFAPAVNALDDVRLAAVLSRDTARGEAFAQQYGVPEVYDNLDDLLRSPQVDAVIVATPDATHEAQVIAAAQAGKHVLCEKPMTTTYAGCQRMAEAVGASGITFAMGYSLRFTTGLQRVASLLQEGRIGQVRYARALWTASLSDPSNWRAQSDQASYWALSAVGTHLVDLWRWYFGEPASVGGCLARPIHNGPNDEISTLVLEYPNRLLAELTVAAIFGGGNRLELYGDNGIIIGEGLFGYAPEGGSIVCNDEAISYTPVNAFEAEVADFVQAIQQQRAPRTTLEDGLRNVQILETAREGRIQLPLA